MGSPPLAWGIPNRRWCSSLVLWDHPHLRGEYQAGKGSPKSQEGSPPLAWGILKEICGKTMTEGITPTCVGNTAMTRMTSDEKKDHPHLRGEYSPLRSFWPADEGSPPLAWGIRQLVHISGHNVGITPTCVGNTDIMWESGSIVGDHPHLRGEYLAPDLCIFKKKGSPPLAWGILAT